MKIDKDTEDEKSPANSREISDDDEREEEIDKQGKVGDAFAETSPTSSSETSDDDEKAEDIDEQLKVEDAFAKLGKFWNYRPVVVGGGYSKNYC